MPNFINPYNFIPFGRKKGKAEIEKEEKKLSGAIAYTVLTRTPLFIPNTSNDKTFQVKIEEDTRDANNEAMDKKSEDKEEHKSYDFFSYHNLAEHKKNGKFLNGEYFEPVIPGSEIRGMLRSNYEILTNSCMSVIEDVVLSKRTSQVFGAGILEKTAEGYELYAAEDCRWKTKGKDSRKDGEKWGMYYRQQGFTEGEKVYFCYEKKDSRGKVSAKPLVQNVQKTEEGLPAKERREGYLIIGEDAPIDKHCAHIFKLKKNKEESRICLLEDLSILNNVIAEYQDGKKPNANSERYQEYATALKAFQKGKEGDCFPVYYSLLKDAKGNVLKNAKEILFLSPASKTREVYQNTITKMLGEHKMCDNKANLCPVCSLFGIIGGEEGNTFAVASKLRFADLTLATKTDSVKKCYGDIVTLPELSSPKLTNMEFYMKKPADDAVFWTYDYYIDVAGKAHALEKPEINGRKFYWHNLNMKVSSAKPNKRNMTIRPLKKNVAFRGKLYFDQISEKELQRLIWLLNAGEDCECIKDAKHGYKLGAAKPLGLGSIAIHVDEVMVRSLDKTEDTIGYTEKIYEYRMDQLKEAGTVLFHGDETIENFRKMTCFKAIPDDMTDKISYPVPDGEADAEGFQWFAKENHQAYRKENGKWYEKTSPNARTQEFFAWYMEPMNTELLETKHPPLHFRNTMDRGGDRKTFSSGEASGRGGNGYSAKSNQAVWKKGEEYEGKITGYNRQKTTAYVQLNDGNNVAVFFKNVRGKRIEWGEIDEVLKKGSKVTVVYQGKNNQGYAQWECIQFGD